MIIRLPRRQPPRPPLGVKLLTHDDREIPHKLVRKRRKDADGNTKWRVVPTEQLSITDFPAKITVEMLPTKTIVYLDEEVMGGMPL